MSVQQVMTLLDELRQELARLANTGQQSPRKIIKTETFEKLLAAGLAVALKGWLSRT